MNTPPREGEPPETWTFTLPKEQWKVLSFLAERGALEQLELYISGKQKHEIRCITEFARAAQALQDLLKEARNAPPEDEAPAESLRQ